jgi:nicotinamide riboside kinase
MSLNFDNEGITIAKIEGAKKYNNKIISVDTSDNDNVKKSFTNLKLDTGKFLQMPDISKEREICYITGPSGSGKSTYCANYIKEYKKLYKKNDIYVFSALKDDKSLDVINPKRIKIDERLISEPLSVSDFNDSLVVFDDIDVIKNKLWRKAIYELLNEILETGRHYNVSCLLTNHLPTARDDTKRILNECHSITYFPHSGNKSALKRLLVDIVGIDKNDMVKIKKSKSRWATIFKNYPQIAMTERNICILNEEE